MVEKRKKVGEKIKVIVIEKKIVEEDIKREKKIGKRKNREVEIIKGNGLKELERGKGKGIEKRILIRLKKKGRVKKVGKISEIILIG